MRRLRAWPASDVLLAAVPPLLTGMSLLGTALAPVWLHRHPLAIVALAPRLPFLAMASGRTRLGPFAAVAFARLVAADVPYFLLARRHGARLQRAARGNRATAFAHRNCSRLFDRAGLVLVAASPTGKVLTLAGLSPLSGRRVAAADAAGTAAQIAAVYSVGRVGRAALLRSLPIGSLVLGGAAAAALAAAVSAALASSRKTEALTCGSW